MLASLIIRLEPETSILAAVPESLKPASWNLLHLPVVRPVATAMFFLAIVVLGAIAVQRMPVELMPRIEGDVLMVNFGRNGSTPEVVEREILIPLQSRASALQGVKEIVGSIRGSSGNLQIEFEIGTDVKVREYELGRIASQIQRESERGTTYLQVRRQSTSNFDSFVMVVHVLGDDRDKDALFDLAVSEIAPRFASVSGIAQATAWGGGSRQVTITVDPQKTADLGVQIEEVTNAVRNNLGYKQFVGDLESEEGRTNVVMDGSTSSLGSLERARLRRNSPATLDHVSDITLDYGIRESIFRVNGKPAVGIGLYQEQGANLLELGRTLVDRVDEVKAEIKSLGIDLVIGTNGAEMIDEQVERLSYLGIVGFVIALLVLSLFLRQWRAVAVVGIAVPVSLTAALSLLYLFGYSINIITLFGLAMSVGLLVDNSVVVYEAILRSIERGTDPANAARTGLKRTIRAIFAASLTTAVVFLPVFVVDIESTMMRQLMSVIAASIVIPVFASLLVAVGLVPLLAHKLAAPAALQRVATQREKRTEKGGLVIPDRARILLSGLVGQALRYPPAWLAGIIFVVIASIFLTLPWISSSALNRDAEQADSIQITTWVSARGPRGLEKSSIYAAQIEAKLMQIEEVETVETTITEEEATFNVTFIDRELRSPDFTAAQVRRVAQDEGKKIAGIQVMRGGGGDYRSGGRGGGERSKARMFMSSRSEIVLSGPDSKKLSELAADVVTRLKNVNYVDNAYVAVQPGVPELWVEPNEAAMDAFGLTPSQALPFLQLAGNRGQTMPAEYVMSSGREIPVVVERKGAREPSTARRELRRIRISTANGILPIESFASIRTMPPPGVIVHRNGRREMKVFYSLEHEIPDTGPTRTAVEDQLKDFIRDLPRPNGYVIDIPEDEETASLAASLGLPVLGLLILILAMTFESLILPFVVLLTMPLAVVGSMWGLALTGTPLANTAMAGVLVLAGLMVNPAILLVDRMQQLARAGYSVGAAAYAAVKERTRPVLMTTSTTIAALWPLAITTGAENEIWPPFAIVIMSGLVAASLLTLIIIPVGYVLVSRLDQIFGRVGPWLVVGWLVVGISIMSALVGTDVLESIFWIVVCSILVHAALLAAVIVIFRRRRIPQPDSDGGPPLLEVNYLGKIYGLPGPIKRTLNAHRNFVQAVTAIGGRVFTRGDTFERSFIFGLLALGAGAIAWIAQTSGWSLIFWLIGSAFLARICIEIRKFRGFVMDTGEHVRGGIEGWIATLLPWIVIATYSAINIGVPLLEDEVPTASWFWPTVASIAVLFGQLIRRSAVRQTLGILAPRVTSGFMRYPRTWLRRIMKQLGGLDLPADEVHALSDVSFSVKRGMIGILGPNGAGKTTLLRQLAGIIEPTHGTVRIGGVPLKAIQKVLARWIGYLPQDAGLPPGHTPREYLQYFAALYDIPAEIRQERVQELIDEVGLSEKIDDKIGSLSGGMRQRVAVARTLLRLPAIIIVDEPTVGLDPRERIRFRNLLARLAQNRIVLFSTHVVEDVAISCERVLVLAGSKLRFDGSPTDLARQADGRVWEKTVVEDSDKALPEGAILAEESPTPDGDTVQRVICENAPSQGAKQLDARPEDGYLWLLATT